MKSTVSDISMIVQRLTTSANERKVTIARFIASGLPKALTLFQLEKVNCARRFEEKPPQEVSWPISVLKKLGRQRRLELELSSSSSHGQGLSNAYLTSEIDP